MSNSIPTFPNWCEVFEALYISPTFKKAGLDIHSLSHFNNQIKTLQKKYIFPLNEPDMLVQSFESSSERKMSLSDLTEQRVIEQYDNEIIGSNQFTLIGDAQAMEFVRVNPKITSLLNLPSVEEFSLARICGMDDTYELYHPEDVIHIIRLGFAALLTASVKGMKFDPFLDYYKVDFRMGYQSPERFFTVERNCKLSNKSKNETGTRHFDVWTIEPGHDEFFAVNATIKMHGNKDLALAAKALFFITNCMLLDLTPRDALLAYYLNNFGYKYFRDKMNAECNRFTTYDIGPFDSETASNMKSNLLKKINSRIVVNTKTQKFKASVQQKSLHFKCGQLGILNMPSLLNECIWRRTEY